MPYAPDKVGANYDLKQGLAPLGGFGNVKDQISVVSGLRIPQPTDFNQIPAGGRFAFGTLAHPGSLYRRVRATAQRSPATLSAGLAFGFSSLFCSTSSLFLVFG